MLIQLVSSTKLQNVNLTNVLPRLIRQLVVVIRHAYGIALHYNVILINVWHSQLRILVKKTQHANGKLQVAKLKNANYTLMEQNVVLIAHAHGMDITVVLIRQLNVLEEECLKKDHHHNELFQKYQPWKWLLLDKLNVYLMKQVSHQLILNALWKMSQYVVLGIHRSTLWWA